MLTHQTVSRKSVATRTRWACLLVCAGGWLALSLFAQDQPAAPGKQPAPAAVAQLKLTNPGFEDGDAEVTGWNRGAAIDGVEYVWDRNAGHNSKSSVSIVKTAQKYFPIAAWTQTVVPTGKTSKLRLSAFVKADKMYKAILDVAFITADGKPAHQWAAYIGAKNPKDPPADHDWKEYSGVVAVPKDAKEVTIGLQVYGPGSVWFDDIKAEYVPDSTPAQSIR